MKRPKRHSRLNEIKWLKFMLYGWASALPHTRAKGVSHANSDESRITPMMHATHARSLSGTEWLGAHFHWERPGYFAMLRTFGYLGEAMVGFTLANSGYKLYQSGKAETLADPVKAIADEIHGTLKTRLEAAHIPSKAQLEYYVRSIDNARMEEKAVRIEQFLNEHLGDQLFKPDHIRERLEQSANMTHAPKRRINYAETAAFSGLAIGALYVRLAEAMGEFRSSVAAEMGKPSSEVTMVDLRRSTNPMIQSTIDRITWRSGINLVTSFPFALPGALGLQAGIVAKVFDILCERSVFRGKTTLEKMRDMVVDVKQAGLGSRAVDSTTDRLVILFQKARQDYGVQPFTEAEMQPLIPALCEVSKALVAGHIGVPEVMHLLGGQVLVLGDEAQSVANVRHVIDVGLEGIAKEKAKTTVPKGFKPPFGPTHQMRPFHEISLETHSKGPETSLKHDPFVAVSLHRHMPHSVSQPEHKGHINKDLTLLTER